jgi:hypothetical protein
MNKKIKINRIKCLVCGDIITSVHRHDYNFCKCGAVAVDGGKDYLKRTFNGEERDRLGHMPYEDLSEYEEEEND